MKKSAIIKLVLVATVAAACGQKKEDEWEGSTKKKVYMRSDTTASYSRSHYRHGFMPFYVFRPFGSMGSNGFQRTGYYSGAIHRNSNVGRNSSKTSIARSGFGRSGFHASS
jgi:hypothetical protein